jgi:hypothetical protein
MEIKKALNKVSENKTVVLKAVGVTVATATAIVVGLFVAKKAKNHNHTDLSA